jgi:glycosyltransferase involved in cell wall biosynthesis
MPGRVIQLVEHLRGADGVGDVARRLASLFDAADIFSLSVDAASRADGRLVAAFDPGPDDVVLLQLAGMTELEALFTRLSAPRAIYFENITPPGFFEPGTTLHALTAAGWVQLARLAEAADVWLAPSAFNLASLAERCRARRPAYVAPPAIDPAAERARPVDGRRLAALRARGETNFLTVGRIVPNKRLDLVMEVFDHYHRHVDRRSRLHLVGDPRPDPGYFRAVAAYRERLGAGDAIEMPGLVTEADLHAYYLAADVFLCLSEHEGLCLPPLVAMAHDVPVVARAATALTETVGGGAILAHTTDPSAIAEVARVVIEDSALRARLVDAGRRHLTRYAGDVVRRQWDAALAGLRAHATRRTAERSAVA